MKTPLLTNAIIILLLIAGFVAMDIYLPSMPAIAKAMHTSVQLTQLTLSIFLFSFGISQFLFGILSDKHGRKPMILIGSVFYIFGSLLTLKANNIEFLIWARLVQGFGAGAIVSVARVVIRDLFHGKYLARMVSLIAMVVALTPAIAPVLGGFLQDHFNFYANFILIFIYGICMLFLTLFFLPETNVQKNRYAIKSKILVTNFKMLFKCSNFIISILGNALAFSVIIVYSTINPFLIQQTLGYSAQTYGCLTLIIVLGLVFGMFANSKLVIYFKNTKLIYAGWWIVICASLLILIPALMGKTNIYFIVPPLLLAVFGVSLVLPNTSTNVFMPFPKIAGTVGAIYGALQVLTAALVGALLSWFHAQTQLELGLMIGILGFLGLSIMQIEKYCGFLDE